MTADRSILEVNDRHLPSSDFQASNGGVVMITPPLNEDFWYFRVRVSEEQAIVGFPKFGTIGIGFAKETDWNTNLPFTCQATTIYEHIKDNKGSRKITRASCIAAIELIRESARRFRGWDDAYWASGQERMR